jgi:cytochrome P450
MTAPEAAAVLRPDALSDPRTFAVGVPHELFARLRRESPVVWVDEAPLERHAGGLSVVHRGSGYWAVTSFADVVAASKAPDVFSSAIRGAFLTDPKSPADLARIRELLIGMDPPQQTTMRQLAASAFTARAMSRLRDRVREHAERVVAATRERGEFDVVRDLAAELPLLVLTDVLGMPREDRKLLFRWSNNLVGFDDPEYGGGSVEAFRQTFGEAFAYALDLAAQRREHPRDDLVSRLVHAELDGRRLTDRQFCHFWVLLVVAGNESTRHLLSGSLLALFEFPDQRDRLVADAGLVPSAVEELLRWVTPTMQFRRTTTHDTELGGQRIRAGEKVVLYYASANRDESVFADSGVLRLDRRPNPHLAFGYGPHFCLGAQLARLEAATMLAVLRPHLRSLEPAGPPVRLASNFMNGTKSWPMRYLK